MDRPHGAQDRITADAARRVAQRRAHRAANLARRAAAARRRAALTVALVALSAVAWLVVGLTSVAMLAAIVPTIALVGVLALGRRAVVHAHAADAAWERERQAPVAAASGHEHAAPVIGRAYHPSDARTEVIDRIRAAGPADASTSAPSRSSAPTPAAAEATQGTTLAAAPSTPTAGEKAPSEKAPSEKAPSEKAPGEKAPGGATASGAAVSQQATVTAEHEEWSPVPVPRPVYTTKAAAPRREPIPLVLDEPAEASVVAAPAEGASAETATQTAGESSAPPQTADSAPGPVSGSLDLNAILARRRSAS